MRPLEIAVAGAGVAGLASAALLARAGCRVTIFDQMQRPAPVGSGLILQPVGLHVLEALGLRARIEALGAKIVRLFGRAQPHGRVVLDVRYAALGEAMHGVAVHRAALFDALYDAAEALGARVELGAAIESAESTEAGVRLCFDGGAVSARFDLVIDALGARSPLSRRGAYLPFGALWTNVPAPEIALPDALEQRYWRASKMAGLLPIGRAAPGTPSQYAYFWSLRRDQLDAWRAAPIDAWKAEALALWPQTETALQSITAHDAFVFASYAHRTLNSPLSGRVVHVGDSWHCTSPQLGQGANMALLDAYALAAALTAQDDLDTALREYARLRLWHIRLYQAASFLFTPAYQSDSALLPWVRDAIVGPISRMPPGPALLAGLVAGVIGAPLRAIERLGSYRAQEVSCAAQLSSRPSGRRLENFSAR